MPTKKIIVTGGAGFIGSAIIPELQRHGHEIFVIDDLSFGNRKFIDVPDSHFLQASILDLPAISTFIADTQPHYVIHLAAAHFIPFCNENPFLASNINIKGTMNVLDVAAQTPSIEKIFFASTAAVYGINNEGSHTETEPPNPLDIYGMTKLTGERLCNEFYLKTKIPTIICRFFNAFGPNETNPHLIPEIQNQINNGNRTINLGNLTPKRDFIHTHDMARAARLLLEKFDTGIEVFNLGQGIEYAVTEIVEAFERQINEKITIVQDPTRIRKVERQHLLANNSKLKAYINWQPEVTIDEGIKTLLK